MAGDDTTGFICKACGRFFSDPEITSWDTKWGLIGGEKWLLELIAACPRCGEIRSYEPNETRFRLEFEGPPTRP